MILIDSVSLKTFFLIVEYSSHSTLVVHRNELQQRTTELPYGESDLSTSRQKVCEQCGVLIDAKQYATHLNECIIQNTEMLDDSEMGQCPLCNQLVKNLLQHCQTCMTDSHDDNCELLGATSIAQVRKHCSSTTENLLIVVYCIIFAITVLFMIHLAKKAMFECSAKMKLAERLSVDNSGQQ